MKTIISKTKIIALAIATLFTATTFTAMASDEVKKPQEIRYVGNVNDLPVYQLTLNNEAKGSYVISIKDNDGRELHNERVDGKTIIRNYQLEGVPVDEYSITFEVRNTKTNTSNVYKINKTKKFFDEVAVNKVK